MKNFLSKYVLHNVWTKIISILLAVIAWSSIMHASDPYITVTVKNVQVTKTNETALTGEGMIYDVVSGESLNVSVYGPRSVVQKLGADDFNAYVNLRELSITDSCPIHVDFKDAEATKNVKVSSKSSEVMVLSLEHTVTESKQVVCVTSGECATGFYAVATVNPATLEIFGSETAVSNVERLVANVDITDRSETFTSRVNVMMQDAEGEEINTSNVTLESETVEVTVTVYGTKNVNLKIDMDISAMKGFACSELRYAPDNITIAGPASAINSITEITIPYTNQDINETINENIILAPYIPENCYRVSDTEFVSLTIPVVRLSEDRQFEVKLKDIHTIGLKDKFVVDNQDDTVTVRVWGVEGTTEELTLSDLALYVDFNSVTEKGTYTLKILNRSTATLMFDEAEAEFVIKDTSVKEKDNGEKDKKETQLDE